MKNEKILKKVKRDYNRIAGEFDATRSASWPEFDLFSRFLKLAPPAGADGTRKPRRIRLLDVGSGNGRLVAFLKNQPIAYTGVDNNKKLLHIAQKKYPEAFFRYANTLKLPFPAASFDTVWCIAVVHHLPSKMLQLRALKEMRRVLKKNAALMLTVWNLWQPKYRRYIQGVKGKAQKDYGNVALIPWGRDKKVQRFYYAFTDKEVRGLLIAAGFSTLKKVPSIHNIAYICW